MANTSGSSRRQLRVVAKRKRLPSIPVSPMATPEIMNSSGIRQRFSAIIGHCSHSAV